MDSLIIQEVSIIVNKINTIIETTRSIVEQSALSFVQNHVKKLALIGAYHKCFRSLSVKTRREAEKLWERHLIRNVELEDMIDTLLDKEKEFDDYLEEIDMKWKEEYKETRNSGNLLKIGDEFPRDVTVKSVENKETNIGSFLSNGLSMLIIVFLRHYG